VGAKEICRGNKPVTVHSLSFLVFAGLVWLLARLVRSRAGRQGLLLLASYALYASWTPWFLGCLIVSSVANYGFGAYVRRNPTASRLWAGIGFNLLLLGSFKYLPPMAAAWHSGSAISRLALPVGISFWTFQALSYLLDLYRGGGEELDPSLLEFSLYLAFFPTVLSGPVCRLGDMLPQFRSEARLGRASWGDTAEGVRRIILGLFMKVVVAQILRAGVTAGEGIDGGFDLIARGWSGLDVWLLAVGFGFQVYFDFAGYSNIVIGVSRLLGLRVAENFRDPYLSPNPSVFWTRWHMSLSFWIRDYVFFPLAGLRRQNWWRSFALVASMALFGLWHGASPRFLLWGSYQGLLLAGHRWVQQAQRRLNLAWSNPLLSFCGWALSFALLCLGWIPFRANSLHQAGLMLASAFSFPGFAFRSVPGNCYVVTAMVVVLYFLIAGLRRLAARWSGSAAWRRAAWILSPAVYGAALLLIIIWSRQQSVFLYLRF
jgi:alginate O-acetyltransferase complex protein AlgI